MNYKMLRVLLLVIMIELLIITYAMAVPRFVLEASPDQVETGGEFTVRVNVEEISSLFAASFELEYDPGLLEVMDASAGDFLGTDVIFLSMPETGSMSIAISKKAGSVEANGTGTLAVIKFRGIAQNSANISVKVDTLALAQFDGSAIPGFDELAAVQETVTIIPGQMPVLGINQAIGQLEAGDEFTLNLTISDVKGLFGASFEIHYDMGVLDYVKSSSGDFMGTDVIFFEMGGDNSVSIAVTMKAGAVPASGSGVIAAITFRARGKGVSPVSYRQDTLKLRNASGTQIPASVENGTVTIDEFTLSVKVSQNSLPADGKSTAIITATLEDSSGSPVSGKDFNIAIEPDGLIQNLRDNGNGTYTATYVASNQPGPVTLTVTVGRHSMKTEINLVEVEPELIWPNAKLTSELASVYIRTPALMKITLNDNSGREVGAPESMIFNLSSDSGTGQFALNENFTLTTSSVTIRANTSSAAFYYRDTKPGDVTITISGDNVEKQTLSLTIKPANLSIIHEPVEQVEPGDDVIIIVNITGEPKPTKLTVSYRKILEDTFTEVDMESAGGGRWESFLPPGVSKNTVGIVYYIRAFLDDFEIDTAPSGQQIFGISIAGLELSHDIPAASYRIISIPLELENADPASSLEPSLGKQTVTTWRLFGYDSTTESYAENQTLKLSRGYWLFSKEAADISITGSAANPVENFTIPLSKGWNLVGNPYGFDVYWGNAVVKAAEGEYVLNDPGANQYVRQKYWWYEDASPDSINNGIFESVTGPFGAEHVIQSWQGYAVYALENCDLILSPSQVEPNLAPSARPTPAESHFLWRVKLTAQSGNMVDSSNYFGVSAGSSDGYDRLDSEKPPFPSDDVCVFFPHSDWWRDSNHYSEDYRSPYGEKQIWHFMVNSARSGAVIQLRWDGIPDIPPEFNAYLIDGLSGETIDMRLDSSYSYQSEYDRDSRDFQILITKSRMFTRPAAPADSVLLQNYPNPFNPETWIPYHLSDGGSVVIRIYSISGKLVRELDLGYKHPGYYDTRSRSAYWDGRDMDGEQASSGVYFYHMSASSFTAIRKMIITR